MISNNLCWSSPGKALAFLLVSSVQYLLAKLTFLFFSSFHLASILSKSTFPSEFKYCFLASSLKTIFTGSDGAFGLFVSPSILYSFFRPSYNLFDTKASVTPNLALGEISAVPSLSIAECSPPIPLAWRPWFLAIYFKFFSSLPDFVMLGNLPRMDCLFPVPMLVGHVVMTP